MQTDFDIAILGSGFAGSLLAMIARRLGKSVLLLEKGRHPRFAIGESTSPLMNLLIEQLATRYDLPRLLPLTTYGTWQATYPHLVCGKKRGFSYYAHRAEKPFGNAPDRSDQLLVAASPHDSLADTHWLRADVDQFFMEEACALGVEYLDSFVLTEATVNASQGVALRGERAGTSHSFRAKLLFDATGPHGALSRLLHLKGDTFAGYPATQALFNHFEGVHPVADLPDFQNAETPPFAPDDAALHHCFEGGWMWVLRFGNGVTSAGFTATEPLAQVLNLSEKEAAWERFLTRFPSIRAQFADAKPLIPWIHAPRLPYVTRNGAGECWALLPSAQAFIDPLFSTGMPLTLLGVERLGRILERDEKGECLSASLQSYAQESLADAEWTAEFVGACYRAFPSFPHFAALSMFYFASASYGEMARRLERQESTGGFLGRGVPLFAEKLVECAKGLAQDTLPKEEDFANMVGEAIASRNVAGLSDPAKHNWYGADLEDVVRNAEKLGMESRALREVLRTAPWAQIPQ